MQKPRETWPVDSIRIPPSHYPHSSLPYWDALGLLFFDPFRNPLIARSCGEQDARTKEALPCKQRTPSYVHSGNQSPAGVEAPARGSTLPATLK